MKLFGFQLTLATFSLIISFTTSNNTVLSYICPGKKCPKDVSHGIKCMASTCQCDSENSSDCTCKLTNFHRNNKRLPYVLSVYCQSYLEEGEECLTSSSCISNCCSKDSDKCVEKNEKNVFSKTCKHDFSIINKKKRVLEEFQPVFRRRTNYTVPHTFNLVPKITISFPSSNKCWADGSCANHPNPSKADVFGSLKKFNKIGKPIKIPGIKAKRPNSPEYFGRFGDENHINYECGDGTAECDYACCSYGFCIDPTNDCTPYTAKASYYTVYTFISLGIFCIVYWVLFWYFGVEYSKIATLVHPDFSRDKIRLPQTNILGAQSNQPSIASNKEKDKSGIRDDENVKKESVPQNKDISLSGGIFPDRDEFSEKI